VSAGYEGYEDDGVVDFAAGVVHTRAARVTSEILALMTELAERGPTQDEVEKAKKRHAWDTRGLADSPEDLAGFYALGSLWERPESPEERGAMLARVTKEQIGDVARLLASPSRLNVVAVGLLDRRTP
jgi:predicted Zn-dependent peptidase